MTNLDWSQCDAVESVPGKMSGAWVFKGTRMPVQTVFINLAAGMSVKEITEVWDVKAEEIEAVVNFVAESLEREPTFGAKGKDMPANVGEVNPHGQRLIRKTDERSNNHRFAKIWILECPEHGTYGANSCDFHIRKCPQEGGKPGLG